MLLRVQYSSFFPIQRRTSLTSSHSHLRQCSIGRGYIEGKRGSDYVVKLFHWKLAQGQSPTCYLNADAIKPLFTVGQAVKTIYGRGYIESIRLQSGDYVVKLDHWKLAQKQSPTLYLAHDAIQPLFSVFEKVKTVYGQGYVQAVREKDYVVKVKFLSPLFFPLLLYHSFILFPNLMPCVSFSTIIFIDVPLANPHSCLSHL